MNKKLIALAVAGACVAPAAMAQTANPVTLYGRAMVSFQSVEAKGGTAPIARRNRVADHNSFLGVRGTEDLGGGLKAFFQLETAFSMDTAPSATAPNAFANRNSAVGLQGGWGSILAGRWDSPMKVTQTAVDPFGNNSLGDIAGAALRQGTFNQRIANNVQYWSPSMAGFTVRLSYGANEGKTATANPHNYGGSLAYASGGFYAALAYEEHKDSIAQTATPGVKETGTAVAASYRFSAIKLAGQYGEYKRTGTETQKSYMLAAEYYWGKSRVVGSWINSQDGGTTGTAQPECDKASIGYIYEFSKRTWFFGEYSKVDNKTGNLCDFGTPNLGGLTNGSDPQGFGIGVRHLF